MCLVASGGGRRQTVQTRDKVCLLTRTWGGKWKCLWEKKNWQRIATAHHYWSGGQGGGCSRGNYPSTKFPIGNNLSASTGFAAERHYYYGVMAFPAHHQWAGHVCGELTLEWIRKVRGARNDVSELTGPPRKRRRRQCTQHKLGGGGDNNCTRGW